MLLISSAKLYSQEYIPYFLQEDNSFIRSRADMVHLNGWVVFNDSVNIPSGGMINLYKDELGFNSSDSLALKSSFEDNFPFTNVNNKYKHLKYQQYFNGVKVEFAEFMEHSNDNKVRILNGKVVNGLTLTIIPSVTMTAAISNAISHYGTTNDYVWTHTDLEQQARLDLGDSNATNYPKGELVLAYTGVGNNLYPEHYKLAWCIRVRSLVPSFDKNIYIDAQTGLFLKEVDNRHYDGWADLSIQGLGNKWIDTRWRGFPHNDFILHANNNRNIETKQHVWVGWNFSSHYNDNDDNWPYSDWKFTIPHWGVNNAYDYFSTTFNRIGCDGINGEIRIRANSGEPTSYYEKNNGKDILTFGTSYNEYRASVDICAHEYTHGIGESHADLNGYGESGAIEESYADIFGIMAEYYSQGNINYDWKIGEDAGQYRDFQNPHNSTKIQDLDGVLSSAQPKFYHGQHWYYGNDDYQGVHVNDGVQNHWFYLLSNGGTVDNITYPGIGMDVASIITYVSYTNFLGKSSNYIDAAIGSVLAAEIFFGNCSQAYNSTWNAWAQVGLAVPISTNGVSIVGQTSIYTSAPYNFSYPLVLSATTYNNQNCTWTYPAQWSCQVGGPNNSNLIINDFNNYYASTAVSVSTLPCGFTATHNFSFSETNSGNTTNPLGRKRFSQGEIVLSPVPTGSNLNIHVESTTYDPATKWNIKVLNFYGIAQFSNNSWTTLPTSINVSNLYAGTYMLQLISNRETVVIPFQKN